MKVTDLWRYPIKSHGLERLETVALTQGCTMPLDRAWAVAHEMAKLDWQSPEWAHCSNFIRGAKAPAIMAIRAKTDARTNRIALSHPDCEDISFNPDDPRDAARFLAWLKPLCPEGRALPERIYKVLGRGITDSAYPSVSINSITTLQDLSDKAQHPLTQERFRGNIWIDGAEPWAEFSWVGKVITIGTTRLKIVERIERCNSLLANPDTGKRDLDTLKVLKENWDHQHFGVLAEVVEDGDITVGDGVVL